MAARASGLRAAPVARPAAAPCHVRVACATCLC